ncbi:DNA mismatch repair protein MutS [Pseudobacteriovorax antillogorgiicola]|uniref:DNA mismatch repair protein MutS n=1 Tax=Pseudobacteriovorax antillogorgiicola TaxID=1513793 RepID=A0A1Y6CII9_9BACT|nr:DNA mismatch repair protein MutS [Pseudobacteriovorax antillogorgiicola]TCS46697.1 DNA mismatch repair protein MutS [Pseudobacteriovorax antillogorgiicola]SMF66850.1 DNA mismatch repair protein MutS [Pseudobacteriovorax antillogorgiicola]
MSKDLIDTSKLTPMMRQFFSLKAQVEDSILFFRMGDFYEIFGDDAEEVAPQLELVLTARERGDKKKIPFCGVPHHSARNYWLKLLKLGYRVAIADQVENPEDAKGLVRREIVQVFTPGCIEDLEGLEADTPNYLMAVYESPNERAWALALVDISTGDFRAGSIESFADLSSYVQRFRPRELLARRFIHDDVKKQLEPYMADSSLSLASLPEGILRDPERQQALIEEKFSVSSLADLPCGAIAAGRELVSAVIDYLVALHATTEQFLSIRPLQESQTMILDETAVRDLEIFETVRRRQSRGSLFREINRTRTPMGARLLRSSLAAPFVDLNCIRERQDHVRACLDAGGSYLKDLRERIKGTPDLERLSTRVLSGKAHPLELAQIRDTLAITLELKDILQSKEQVRSAMTQACSVFSEAREPLELLGQALAETPSPLGSLGVFAEGHDLTFDQKRELSANGRDKISQYEQKLRDETGIASLKIKNHKTFGLLIEVTKANLNKVPESFIRRQTMVNNERFVTDELVALGDDLATATDDALQLEYELYTQLLDQVGGFRESFKRIAGAIAFVDLIQGFAWLALENSYVCPDHSKSGEIELVACRHPVVEGFVGRHEFVPNDVVMSKPDRHLLITGPNMAGKSTVMRQTAIAAIMHQIGCYVAASRARLPIFDRLFTRVGAADDLSRGQSTFMVEMSEAASILRQASPQSLVILDEVGRGTSTQDGMAIASAILESLAKDIGCYSLFATHYHELVPLADSLEAVRNVQVEVSERGESVQFTHRLIPGASSSSFGIEVAKLAGVPDKVIGRAKRYLSEGQNQLASLVKTKAKKDDKAAAPIPPLEVQGFDAQTGEMTNDHEVVDRVIAKLRGLNINRMTPLQALSLLDQLQTQIEECKQQDIFEDFAH